ncbi:MAG TPA: prepilin-type N-terminal cleavage/methylation domain-containing protein [Pirellulaceae bacterium]|jgi:prepilin-type N-terminal cleavage/methylation domain-containing protein|nr:prepilin-type N-terminal cleavage/methylation domain-containing protein [Pirellulaceae bacterium]
MHLPRHLRAPAGRRAFTLVELLVAVAIAALLVAIAIPALKLNLRGQSIREAARQINSFIDEARSQAAGSGRPFGVIIERDGNGSFGNPRRAYRLYHCEVPIPYTGGLLPEPEAPDPRLRTGSRAYFTSWTAASVGAGGSGVAHLTYANLGLIAPGDEIAFDGAATRYQVLRSQWVGTTQTRVEVQFSSKTASLAGAGSILPEVAPTEAAWDASTPFTISPGHSFRVYRQPVKIASSILELPRSAAIDLDWSGVGAAGVQFSEFNQSSGDSRRYALNPIVILFEPSGAVRSVQAPVRNAIAPGKLDLEPQRVHEPIYLLIGRLDQVEDTFPARLDWADRNAEILSNVLDPDSLWIKINPSSGMTLTVENIGPANRDPDTFAETGMPAATDRGIGALNARALARASAGADG